MTRPTTSAKPANSTSANRMTTALSRRWTRVSRASLVATLEIDGAVTARRRPMYRALRTYAFLTAVAVGLLLGVGLRFLPADAAATPDNAAGGAAATACAAK